MIWHFRCGTKPYLAPEVFKGPYCARPVDVWSCGIVFVAMLTGGMWYYVFCLAAFTKLMVIGNKTVVLHRIALDGRHS